MELALPLLSHTHTLSLNFFISCTVHSQKLTASNVTATITTKGSNAFNALESGIQMAVQAQLTLKFKNQTVLNRSVSLS